MQLIMPVLTTVLMVFMELVLTKIVWSAILSVLSVMDQIKIIAIPVNKISTITKKKCYVMIFAHLGIIKMQLHYLVLSANNLVLNAQVRQVAKNAIFNLDIIYSLLFQIIQIVNRCAQICILQIN